MQPHEDLRGQLFELVYGLLDEPEVAKLRERMAAEPELAGAYEEVRRAAALMAQAARLEVPPIELGRPSESGRTERRATTAPNSTASPPRWQKVLALATAALVIVTLGGYSLVSRQPDVARRHVRLVVAGPAAVEPGVEQRYHVTTTSATGDPLPVNIQYALLAPDGKALHKDTKFTNARGEAELTIPANTKLTAPMKLEVLALHDGKRVQSQSQLALDTRRLVTQLSLDKPLYQPGETIYYRSLTLDRFGLNAIVDLPVHFEIRDPSGAVVPESALDGITRQGVGSGSLTTSTELPGGEYALVASSPGGAFPEEKRKFFIRQYRVPRLKKDLEFTRDSYAPGDRVVADFSVIRAEGGPAAAAPLRITAIVDGQVVHQATQPASPAGTFQVEFALPAKIERGDGQLAIVVDDGGTQETIAKTIPINLGKVDMKFFAESGDLVAGVENRVYFTARDMLAKPVHVEGRVVDSQGRDVARLETKHEGMGSFALTPQLEETYTVKLSKPLGVASEPKLPAVNKDLHVVLSTGPGVFDPGKPIEMSLRTSKDELPLVVSAWCRGAQVGTHNVTAKRGENRLTLPLAKHAAGVVRLTVFDCSLSPPMPVAERLVYSRPQRKLNVHVADHRERYTPGEAAEVSLVVTDETGEATPAILGISVVDDSLLKMADDKTPQLATHLLLTTEVEKPQDLEKADFYLSDDAKAPAALDLLLGTQGWRRFVERSLEELQKKGQQNEEITRLAALGGAASPPVVSDNLAQIEAPYQAELAAAVAKRGAAVKQLGQAALALGLALGLLWALVAAGRAVSNVRLWGPALAGAAACAVLGGTWLATGNHQPKQLALAAYKRHELTPPPAGTSLATSYRYYFQAPVNRLGDFEWDFDADHTRHWADMYGLDLYAANGTLGENYERFDMFYKLNEHEVLARSKLAAERRGGWGAFRGDWRRGDMLFAAIPADGLGEGEIIRRRMALAGAPPALAGGGQADLALGGLRAAGLREELKLRRLELAQQIEHSRFVVREYAHKHVAGQPGVRSDFAETLFWHPQLVTGPDGRAKFRFELSDAVTAFRVMADAHAANPFGNEGRIGSGGGQIVSRMPFSLEPKLPLEVTAGDRIELPVAAVNDTNADLPVSIAIVADKLLQLSGPSERQVNLRAEKRAREFFTLDVVGQTGPASVEVRGLAGNLSDAKRQTVRVVPPGFPIAESYAGRLTGEQQLTVRLPADWVPGSLEVSLAAYPSTLADLQKGMDSILQEPNGCFEQASTTNYPNVLTLQYLQEHKVANPEVTRRAKQLLGNGYGRLTGYECKAKGYEWFGSDPGHEALSAYGLMQFRDMSKVYAVDPQMIERTAAWLLARRDGQGGFQRNEKALDSFGGAPKHITDAYIVWALSESGQKGIDKELSHATELGRKSEDPYVVALCAASAVNAGEAAAGEELLGKLARCQAADGHLNGNEGSITRSGGISLTVETTALAALAWLKQPAFRAQAEKAIDWIAKNRQGGGFGSTQGTILALKALVEHAKANRKTVTGGELIVKRGNDVIGRQPFGSGHENAISIEGLAAKLQPGENSLTISLSGNNQMPYALDISYRARTPASHPDCPVKLSTKLASSRIRSGDMVALTAEISNVTDKGQPMTVAILGLPAGLQPRPDQLDRLKKAGTIDYYETRAREVICYWRSLAPSRKVDLKLDLVAEWPGKYTAPASRAYLYYTAERKQWVEPVSIEIEKP